MTLQTRHGHDEDDPLRMSVSRLQHAYRSGELRPTAVAERALDAIEASRAELNAVLTPTPAVAFELAEAAEKDVARGVISPLTGIPVTVKDLFDVAGVKTTFGSLVHDPEPAGHDSGAVRRIRAAGAIIVGKSNTAEFGQSATTENLLGPPAANPHDVSRTAGGSSGGAAASVAAGLVPLALGSDGGGSIRIPAAFSGVVGVKPTIRLCPNEGGLSAMSAFSSPGPLARHVDDARRMLGVLADTAFPRPVRRCEWHIGYCRQPSGHPIAADVLAVTDAIAGVASELGWKVEETEWDFGPWRTIFGTLVLADEAADRAWLLRQNEHDLTDYQRETLIAALALDPAEVEAARLALPRYRADVAERLAPFDGLLTPTTAVTAFPHGQRPQEIAGQHVDRLWGPFPFTAPFNVAGTPAASIPVNTDGALPVGVQLVCPVGHDAELLAMAEELHEAIRGHSMAAGTTDTDRHERAQPPRHFP